MNGIIIINKPKNYTSFDVIAILRKKLGQRKIGHMGTLDPMATGVLPILLGETAKFQIYCQENDKQYSAKIHFGTTTDSLDITGKVLTDIKSNVTKEALEKALDKFKGNIKQIPPMFSAIKKDGKKLYNLARNGITVEREPRDVTIKKLDLINFDERNQNATIDVLCSKGTYIRSLCSDIGETLRCGAVMIALNRTKSNGFDISQSIQLDKLKELPIEKIAESYLLPTDSLFKNLKKVNISASQEIRFKNGGNLSLQRIKLPSDIKNHKVIRVYNGRVFVGLGKIDVGTDELKILKCQIN